MLIPLGECYANACFAEWVAEALRGLSARAGVRLEVWGDVVHKRFFGRDRVLREADRIARLGVGVPVLFIDAERGVMREYLGAVLAVQRDWVRGGRGVRVGVVALRRSGRLGVVVLFDPDFEEALAALGFIPGGLDPGTARSLKSSEACITLESLSVGEKARRTLVAEVAEAIIEAVRRAGDA